MREYRRCVIPSKITTTSPCLNANVRVLMQILDYFVFVELDSEPGMQYLYFVSSSQEPRPRFWRSSGHLADEPGVVVQ